MRPDLRNRAGTAVYEHVFTVPESFRNRRVLLRFGAVDYFTEAWVNGVSVGTHEGGYTPFEFEIDPTLHGYGPDYPHTLLVRVTDSTVDQDTMLPNGEPLRFAEIPHGKQSWYTSVGGIWQSVFVEARARQAVRRVAFYPDLDTGEVVVCITLEGFQEAPKPGWQLRICIDAPRGAGNVEQRRVPMEDGLLREGEILRGEIRIPIPDPLLWTPETPHLYQALITLENEGEIVDAVSRRFGMRKVEAREGKVWLNGRPYFLMGALDQAFYPRTIYTPPSDEFLRDQFQKARAMGLNLMRCHIKIPTENYLDLCDEIGLLVWYELPNGARLTPGFQERARCTLAEMWERDASHPCIVIVSIMNESWGIDLNDVTQRRWLADTYRWLKRTAPAWLVVDNSACIPNFHVVSDLDDYHIYFNIPDQAEDFAEWVHAFAGREAGTFTAYGDAEYRRNEPLLISEFGNWGLPLVENILDWEGGEPYWFKTGDGAARPYKVLHRFLQQGLDRVFGDYNALARASQEQEWLSLKWEIEEIRRYPDVAGYVITEFTDVNWECNGLLDMGRRPKVFHDRLKDLQAQDILIPRLSPRAAFWEGETAALSVYFSCFSGRSVANGTLAWQVEGCPQLLGSEQVRMTGSLEREPEFGSYPVAQIWITAPPVEHPVKCQIGLSLTDAGGTVIARSTQSVVFVQAARRAIGRGRTVWLHDPFGTAIGLSSLLTGVGCRVVSEPEPGTIGLVTRWDPSVSSFLRNGGKAILVATHPRSITIASGLGVRLLERNSNGWWGDWCTAKIWFDARHFPSLPDTERFDFEYEPVVPARVVMGPVTENVRAGIFVGWLHNPAALVAELSIGEGRMLITTLDLLPHIGSDPIATLILHDLLWQLDDNR